MVRSVPCFCQRRPEVTTRSRRHAGARNGFQCLRERDVFHERNRTRIAPPARRLRAARRSPGRRWRSRSGAIARSSSPRQSPATRRLPRSRRRSAPMHGARRARDRSRRARLREGSCLRAGRGVRPPRATAAPAFICEARPRGASITRSANAMAMERVASRLPPSTTITSAPAARNALQCARARPRCPRPRPARER